MLAGVATMEMWYSDPENGTPPVTVVIEHRDRELGFLGPDEGVSKAEFFGAINELVQTEGDVVAVYISGEAWHYRSKNGETDGVLAAVLSGKVDLGDVDGATSVARISAFGLDDEGNYGSESVVATVNDDRTLSEWRYESHDKSSEVKGRMRFDGLVSRNVGGRLDA